MNHIISSEDLELIKGALEWTQPQLGKITRPSRVDKALDAISRTQEICVEFSDIPQAVLANVQRRHFLCAHTPACPACGLTTQIQLKDWLVTPAEWKCRTCNHKWSFEPTPA